MGPLLFLNLSRYCIFFDFHDIIKLLTILLSNPKPFIDRASAVSAWVSDSSVGSNPGLQNVLELSMTSLLCKCTGSLLLGLWQLIDLGVSERCYFDDDTRMVRLLLFGGDSKRFSCWSVDSWICVKLALVVDRPFNLIENKLCMSCLS